MDLKISLKSLIIVKKIRNKTGGLTLYFYSTRRGYILIKIHGDYPMFSNNLKQRTQKQRKS